MKKEYPEYPITNKDGKISGKLQEIKQNLNLDELAVLEKFLKICRTTAGEKKIEKIERILLQIRDVIEKPLDKWTQEDITDFLVILKNGKSGFSVRKRGMDFLYRRYRRRG